MNKYSMLSDNLDNNYDLNYLQNMRKPQLYIQDSKNCSMGYYYIETEMFDM